MSTASAGGRVIEGGITYHGETGKGQCYKGPGPAQGLIMLDMGVEPRELRRMLTGFPGHYAGLLRYGTSARRTAGRVAIQLVLGQEHYGAVLNKGEESGGGWVSSGPVINQAGRDVKLAGFFARAGLHVADWTRLSVTGRLPPRYPPLQSVTFAVDGTTWTLLGGAAVGGQRGAPVAPTLR